MSVGESSEPPSIFGWFVRSARPIPSTQFPCQKESPCKYASSHWSACFRSGIYSICDKKSRQLRRLSSRDCRGREIEALASRPEEDDVQAPGSSAPTTTGSAPQRHLRQASDAQPAAIAGLGIEGVTPRRSFTASSRAQTPLMAHALLDNLWPAVRRLVRVLCAHRLPVTLPAPS
jgi:hypothetical protein